MTATVFVPVTMCARQLANLWNSKLCPTIPESMENIEMIKWGGSSVDVSSRVDV